MKVEHLLVLAEPTSPYLNHLERLAPGTTVTVGLSEERLGPAIERAQVLLIGAPKRDLLRTLLPRARALRWIHALSAGVENLLFEEFIHSPLPLTNSRGVYSGSLGEFALAAMLFFAKELRRLVRQQAEARWDQFMPVELRGRTLGILGYGDIGRAVAERARPFGMRILACRRRPSLSEGDPLVDEVFPLERRLEMIAASDYLLLAMPHTPGTYRLMGEAELRAMKPHSVLINIGRGSTVDEVALVKALEEGRLGGAALDVFETEPLPAGHAFWRLENVLLSPHCADQTPTWRDDAMALFLRNLDRFEKGEPLVNIVDKEAGY
ncbi:D-2-hydroxyacid dehydrogenase [Vitiosangium sp. GDMCC 1.1324]|uniref:D-2-hydroxyacid dehydrogenase n=1 Tax=Vitiosangium sp. (strain GDMCC 1.1324) TaxID=2138576 RepID=UPI000D3C40BD|nr:D-2-hydroxyacid dehydrogenase [Vitiosangium sp. GDMCC 1.1324]PTL76070.1 hydroxyacid dehydrogenase [Vitiosangium sp. GDMCC 1.1324]